MFEIRQFRYSNDNFSYVIREKNSFLAIDGGAVNEILAYVADCGGELDYVTITHDHPDHTVGNYRLLTRSNATFLDHRDLVKRGRFHLGDGQISIIPTPGHTMDSVVYHVGKSLITGDTLFNGTVGNCFSFDLHAFLASIKTIMNFPKITRIYAGHDYVLEAMDYARSLEPANVDIDAYLSRYDKRHVYSTLDDELAVNPFLRFNQPEMVKMLRARDLPHATEFERWQSLME